MTIPYTFPILVFLCVCFRNCSILCNPCLKPNNLSPTPPRSLGAYVIACGNDLGYPSFVGKIVVAYPWNLLSFTGGITGADKGYPTVGR